ncbi:hypothetical protein LUZ60_006559 [Juncus effusus]|nr:hypothetical protein LUZ60_006559 [Juncus effusus]
MLLSLKPHPSFFLKPKLFLSRPLSSSSSSSSSFSTSSSSAMSTIEHIVLFKVRPTADPSTMISSLNSLSSLPAVSHISAGPVLRLRSAAANDLGFTHILHSRYESKEKLSAYANDPAHVSVVKELVLPICEDIMAVDWIGNVVPGPVAPGSAARLTLAKLKEGSDALELTSALTLTKEVIEGTTLLSYGENFSPARAKGYSFGMIAAFPKVDDLEKLDGAQLETFKEKVRPVLDGLIVLDFVFSDSTQSSANL